MVLIIKIFILSIIVTIVHELGHYVASRIVGLHPDLVHIGIGRRIFKKGIFELCILPVNGMINNPDQEWAALSPQRQNLVALSGPGINLIIGLATIQLFPLFGILNLLGAISNLVPFRTKIGPSDGGYVLKNIKSTTAQG